MRFLPLLGGCLALAVWLHARDARAQLVTDGGTNVIDGFSTNIAGNVTIGDSADFTLLILTNDGDVLNTGIAYIGRNAGSEFNRVIVHGAGSTWSNLSDLFVGFAGANNALFIQGGGTVSNRAGILGGNSAGATNNRVVVDGAGSLWLNQNDLEIGLLGGGNAVLVTNGGRAVVRSAVAADGTYLGHFSGAGGNRLLISGAGSVFSNQYTLHHGYGAGGNLIRVADGGRLDTEVTWVGEFTTASNNTVEVTGANSFYRNVFEFVVGSNSAGNRLMVSDGGRLVNTVGVLGGSATASNNLALVIGGGSLWSNSGSLHIGGAGARNHLVVSNGGTVFARNAANLGLSASSTNNRIEIAGGSLIVSNAGGTATLDIRRGTNVLNAGLLHADQLVMTNTPGVFEFNGGTLITRGGLISNGAPFLVGASGSTPGIWDVRAGGSNTIAGNQVVVGSGAPGSQLLVTNGALLLHTVNGTYHGILGNTVASSNNLALIAGPGSFWNMGGNDLIIGSGSSGNRLVVENGGVVRNDEGVIGQFSTASNNAALVTGSGSLWSNNTSLLLGIQSGENRLWVSNAGVVSAGNLYVGASHPQSAGNLMHVSAGARVESVNGFIGGDGIFGGSNNVAVVTGSGSLWRVTGALFVGASASANQLIVSNGGTALSATGYVGYDNVFFNFFDNVARVTGAGSLWSNATDLYVGYSVRAISNRLVVSDGGTVLSSNSVVGAGSSVGNRAVVTGSGSLWSNRDTLIVGSNSAANLLVVSNGGTVFARNAAYLGFAGPTISNNRIEITGGNLIVTNISGTGAFDIRRGTNVLNGGLVDVDRLFVTNSLGRFELLKGILRSRWTVITNGFAFEVGNGTDVAFAELEGAGTHRFGNGLVLRSNGTVRARSATPILSPAGITIQTGGTLLYQEGDQLAAATPLTLSGGALDLGGHTQAPVLGALTLSATSTIDFGAGGAQTLEFSGLASFTPGSLLVIRNWTGTPTHGGGTDQILFTGGAGVTPGFLSEVRFIGFPDGALLLGTGEIVPTPEPATWVALAALGGTLGWRASRRHKSLRAAQRAAPPGSFR